MQADQYIAEAGVKLDKKHKESLKSSRDPRANRRRLRQKGGGKKKKGDVGGRVEE